MTREETSQVIKMMQGTTQIAANLMNGSRLRISELIRLCVQNIYYNIIDRGRWQKTKLTRSVLVFVNDVLYPDKPDWTRPVSCITACSGDGPPKDTRN
jgi:hypothetical protein